MADEDKSQQTEDATQKRLDEAHAHGDVVKSSEVTAFVLLAGGALALAMFGGSIMENLARFLMRFIQQPETMDVTGPALMEIMRVSALKTGLILAPFMAVMVGAGLAGNILQSRPMLTWDRIAPDFSKLSLSSGLARMFGPDGWMNLIKGLLKIAIVGTAIWTQLWPERTSLQAILTQSTAAVVGDMAHLLFKLFIASLSALAVIAAADYFFQRYRFFQRNKMSKQEIKEEYRQNEGDPHVKAKIRQIRNERARKRMMAKVPNATVVIMNPTHFAVALQYESGKMAAPVCVAKGVDAVALRIRAVAEENDVPVVENAPLARALYASVELDETVPPEHFKAVAQVIGYVMRLNGSLSAAR